MTPKQIEQQRERNAAVYNSARRIIDGWPEWKKRWISHDEWDAPGETVDVKTVKDIHAKFADEVFKQEKKK